jgi:hypothetical protein
LKRRRRIYVLRQRGGGGAFGNTDPYIALSGWNAPSTASLGDLLGTLSIGNAAGNWLDPITYTAIDTDGNRIAIDGDSVERGTTALDFGDHPTLTFEIEADNGTDPPLTRIFEQSVTNNLVAIAFSGTTIAENSTAGDLIGTLSLENATGNWLDPITYTLLDTDGLRVDVDGADIEVGVTLLDFEDHPLLTFEVQADNGTDAPITEIFTADVTNVLDTTLIALTLGTNDIDEGDPEDTLVGALVSVTPGSTLSLTDSAGSRFKLSGSNIVAGSVATDYGTATTHNITVRETHPDGINSPNDSVISIDVIEVVADVTAPTILSLYPPDNATGVSIGVGLLIIEFSEFIVAGTGSIDLYDSGGIVHTWTDADFGTTLNVASVDLELTLPGMLDPSESYYVMDGTGLVEDLAGNPFAGIGSATVWNFDTAAASGLLYGALESAVV